MSPSGYYLDSELSLEEQREMLEGFYEEIRLELIEPERQGALPRPPQELAWVWSKPPLLSPPGAGSGFSS